MNSDFPDRATPVTPEPGAVTGGAEPSTNAQYQTWSNGASTSAVTAKWERLSLLVED
jgi:hypothetical protein